MGARNSLKVKNDAELLSYIINTNPVLRENVDLPVQGQSIKEIGRVIVSNERYRNAFIDTVNLIGLTMIKRNAWQNPWDFTLRGQLNYGQQIREIILDLCNVYDYNAYAENVTRFLQNEVPNVFQYIHEINFQKFYETTTSDEQLAMAFEQGDLFSFVEMAIGMLYESYQYDTYLVDKYMLQRRALDGTMTPLYIEDFNNKTTREIVAEMKACSNKMTFRSPNYNPAGIRKAVSFDEQITILNCEFDSKVTTEVLATSYFRNDAEMKTRLALADSFSDTDEARLTELLGSAFIPFTDAEKTQLQSVIGAIISREWFMDYTYAFDNGNDMKQTEFYNPSTLKNNHFLHVWRCFSTSPFESAVIITKNAPSVTAVSVSPESATMYPGQQLQLSASVTSTGFANKSVLWSINKEAEDEGASINQNGVLVVPSTYDNTKSGTAGVYTLDIETALATSDTIKVGSTTYTVGSSDDTAVKQATALVTALGTMADYNVTRTSAVVTFTEKSGHYGAGAPVVVVTTSTGKVTEATTTEAVLPTTPIIVTAKSIYNNSISDTASITIG